jgi:hypothetical protein
MVRSWTMSPGFFLHPEGKEFCERRLRAAGYARPSSWSADPAAHARTLMGFEYMWLRENHPDLLIWHRSSIAVPVSVSVPEWKEPAMPAAPSRGMTAVLTAVANPWRTASAGAGLCIAAWLLSNGTLPVGPAGGVAFLATALVGIAAARLSERELRCRPAALREAHVRRDAMRASHDIKTAEVEASNGHCCAAILAERDAYFAGFGTRGHIPADLATCVEPHPRVQRDTLKMQPLGADLVMNVAPQRRAVNAHVIRRPATRMNDRPWWPRPPVDTDVPRRIDLPLILVPRSAGDHAAASVMSDDDEP